MAILIDKFKEVFSSVLPITIIVLILNFTIVPLETSLLIKFLIGAFLVIIGLSIFLFGVDIGITPMGSSVGSSLTKSNKVWIITSIGLFIGFFISIAEPDLHILAGQVDMVTEGLISKSSIVLIVSLGIGVMISLGLLRIVKKFKLNKFLTITYLLIFILALFTTPEFLAILFDASGATTGAMTVPFILALALGVSAGKKDSKASEEDSFGLVGIASAGAIIAVMMMNVVTRLEGLTGSLPTSSAETSDSIIGPFIKGLPETSLEVLAALLPLLIFFWIFQKTTLNLPKKTIKKIIKGVLYTFIGLVLFLVGVNAGFMNVGRIVGYNLAGFENKAYLIVVAFILGLVTVLAEPAVHVLTHQVENVTSGYVKGKAVLFSLSIGVAFSVTLAIIKIIVPEIQLWHYLLPGYIISIILSYLTPKLFVGMAFDSGGVASGPMTATFILAFAQGTAAAVESADVLIDGFGIIAMVAMIPLIAIQILGLMFKIKSVKGGLEINAK